MSDEDTRALFFRKEGVAIMTVPCTLEHTVLPYLFVESPKVVDLGVENDVRLAGHRVESRGGAFFKPFANYQFDLLIKHKVIDKGYLDGCCALGMQYPELTASIYIVCRKD